MELGEHSTHTSCIKHAQGRTTRGEIKQQQQRWQMNEGSGRRGEIPQQDSNVTGRDMRGRFITRGLVVGVEG